MAINRLWFPNAPVNGIPVSDRAQLSVGWPLKGTAVTPTTEVQTTFDENYIRRYLNDMPQHQKTA